MSIITERGKWPRRFFLAGIMQGSLREPAMHAQDYRQILRKAIEDHVPGAEVYCPLENHRQSLGYGDGQGGQVFFEHLRMAADAGVLVAYLPEASMGTAVEMWEAHRAGRVVLTISPLARNWVVRFLSQRVFADIEEFVSAAQSGELARMLRACPGTNL